MLWEPHKNKRLKDRQSRLIYYPELRNWIGARDLKGKEGEKSICVIINVCPALQIRLSEKKVTSGNSSLSSTGLLSKFF